MKLTKNLVDQTGIRAYLNKLDLPQPGSNRGYDPHGYRRELLGKRVDRGEQVYSQFLAQIRQGAKEIFSWKEVPSQSIYSRFFHKFTWKHNDA